MSAGPAIAVAAQRPKPHAKPATRPATPCGCVNDVESPVASDTAIRFLSLAANAGNPLDSHLRQYFEPRLGFTLGEVRVVKDAQPLVGLGARAATLGKTVSFAPGHYQPHSRSGVGLIAHELVHVGQQACGGTARRHDTEREAATGAKILVHGGRHRVTHSATVAPAFALSDYEKSMSDGDMADFINGLSPTRIQSDIDEINEFLSRQNSTTDETLQLEQHRDQLQARLAAVVRAANTGPPKPKVKAAKSRKQKNHSGGTAAPLSADAPRILRERTSLPTTDATEVREEIDKIIAWLQRGDVSNSDRDILQMELQNLAPEFQKARAQESAVRNSERVQQSLTSVKEGAEGLKEVVGKIVGIGTDPGDPEAAFIMDRGERVRISKLQAAELRKGTVEKLRDGVRTAKDKADMAAGLYDIQTKINKDHRVVSTIAGWLGGADDPGVALMFAKAIVDVQVRQAEIALNSGDLVAVIDPLVEASNHARKIYVAVHAWQDDLISGAELAAKGLSIVRDVSAAIATAIAAVVFAPFVAGAVGAGGLGFTGALGTGVTIAGTGAGVGLGAGGVFGAAEFGGQKIAGASNEQALDSAGKVAWQRFKEGAAAGAGGATTRVVAQALGPGTTALTQFGSRAVSQASGSFVGGTTYAKLDGEDWGTAVVTGGKGAGLGLIGTTAGAPSARSQFLQTATSSGVGFGVDYFHARSQGASSEEALRGAGTNLAVNLALHRGPGMQKELAGIEAKGRNFGAGVKSAGSSAVNTTLQTSRALMLGLKLSSPVFEGRLGSPSTTDISAPAWSQKSPTGQTHDTPQRETEPQAQQTKKPAVQQTNAESEMGIGTQQRAALKETLGKPMSAASGGLLGTIWQNVTNHGEPAQLNLGNSRRLFDNQRGRFWRAVAADPQARQMIAAMGGQFEGAPGTAPVIVLPDGRRLPITIDHITERQTDPTRALDPTNLQLSSRRENTVMLRQFHEQDPFINPPAGWTPL